VNNVDLVALLTQGGAVTILAVIVVAFLRGWVVPGSYHDKVVAERDEWKDLAVELMQTASKAVGLVERP
jgi:hypothetical protein